MDNFVTKEGFNSVEECFVAIERAVKADKREHAVRMEELTEQLKALEVSVRLPLRACRC